MLRYRPGSCSAGLTSYCAENASVVSPKLQPAWKAAMLAFMISGFFANFRSRKAIVASVGRWYSHDRRPSANMFFARSASFLVMSKSSSAVTVIEVSGSAWTRYSSSEPSSTGLDSYPTLARLRLVNSSVLTIRSAPRGRSPRLALRAAGFIATRTLGASPGVRMSWSAKCNWKLDTPGSVPAGARISAGKFGNVDKSLPNAAVSWVKRSPVSCMPSPESPAKRMMTRSSCWTCLVTEEDLLDAQHPSWGRRPGS